MAASACHGALAQLGERGLCKPEVRGSIPLRSTINELGEHFWVFAFLHKANGRGRERWARSFNSLVSSVNTLSASSHFFVEE